MTGSSRIHTAPTILVVDDTPDNLTLISGLLKDEYKIKVANNGERALKIVQGNQPPDLILLDIMMPEMDGYEVCRRLKDAPQTADIPVIFLTAKSDSADEKRGLEAGAIDYITKPVVPAILQARVATHLALRVAQQELAARNATLMDEKEVLDDIMRRMRDGSPYDARHVHYIQRALESTAGDIVLSALRKDGEQHVLVGDLSGHGLPAAMAAPLISYIFYRMTQDGCDMGSILSEINRTLFEQLPTQLYLATSALALSPDRSRLHIWNYGCPPVLCLDAQRPAESVNSADLPLGILAENFRATPHATLTTTTSMRIYQYSDGITEATSPSQELYGQARFEDLLTRVYREGLPLEYVWQVLDEFCAAQALTDDALLVETRIQN